MKHSITQHALQTTQFLLFFFFLFVVSFIVSAPEELPFLFNLKLLLLEKPF